MKELFLLVLSLLTLAVGCGGGGEPAGAPKTTLAPSAPPPQAPPRAAAPAVRPAVAPEKKTANPKDAPEQELTSSDFLYMPEPPRYEIATAEEVALAHGFSVIRPRTDSQHFLVDPPIDDSADSSRTVSQIKLPVGFEWLLDAGLNPAGYPYRIRCTADDSEMVLVESGTFTQGVSQENSNASPEVSVYVSAFYIDATEVTVRQYKLFQAEETKASPPRIPENAPPELVNAYPATGISHGDASAYAEWVGKSLPTESEWERAARGPAGHRYPWGNSRPPIVAGELKEVLPVKSRPTDVTSTGLFDMAANAREWVSDWYAENAYKDLSANPGSPPRDPQGPKRASLIGEKVVRGSHELWDLWTRGHANVKKSGDDIGFRCVLRITEEMLPPKTAANDSPQSSTNGVIAKPVRSR